VICGINSPLPPARAPRNSHHTRPFPALQMGGHQRNGVFISSLSGKLGHFPELRGIWCCGQWGRSVHDLFQLICLLFQLLPVRPVPSRECPAGCVASAGLALKIDALGAKHRQDRTQFGNNLCKGGNKKGNYAAFF
jgi:hypothetical protein